MEGSDFLTLVGKAKGGDKDAFGTLYESHLTPVYRYVFARLRDRQEAEDITQEAFLRAYQSIARFEVTSDSLLPYLFTIARNLLINRSKKKKPDYLPSEDIDREGGGMPADTFARAEEDKAVIDAALEVLSESEREIIELRFFAERTYAEIAEICDKKEDAVRQHVARGMKKMRVHMSNLNES